MVLDDPVEHDVDAIGGVEVGVGVGLGDAAVGGPARVSDPGGGLALGQSDRMRVAVGLGGHGLAQEGQVADRADRLDAVAAQQRDARGVIAAVLEPLEPLEKELSTRPVANVSDDPAHVPAISLLRP